MEFVVKSFDELTKRELYEILRARHSVFHMEKKMYCQDLDGYDYDYYHAFLHDDGKIVAYLRMNLGANPASDYIRFGRCLTTVRGEGWGAELMNNVLFYVRKVYGNHRILLHAQKDAVGFYEKFGFKVTSKEFMEAGVPHYEMKVEI